MKTKLAQKQIYVKDNGIPKIDGLLKRLINKGASDLHLVVQSPPVLRINGLLVPQEDMPTLNPDDIDGLLSQTITKDQRSAFNNEHELDSAYSMVGVGRFRINALKQRGSTSLAFRLVPFDIPTIDELGLPQICKQLILKPRGLILVTGPSGSGKSTTLAAMINHLNQNEQRNVAAPQRPGSLFVHAAFANHSRIGFSGRDCCAVHDYISSLVRRLTPFKIKYANTARIGSMNRLTAAPSGMSPD